MRRPGSPRSAAEPAAFATSIDRVGADGDGIGRDPDGAPVYVPFTLPGEHVHVERAGVEQAGRGPATLLGIETPSPDRAAPPCPHFGACGGCALQHWADAPYAAWKAGLLAHALTRAGYGEITVASLVRTPPAARRRIDLTLVRAPDGVRVGLNRARSSETIDLHACSVLHPALFALIAPLRALLAGTTLLRRQGSAMLNLLDTGPDLLLRTDAAPDTPSRARIARFAAEHALPRITWALGDRPTEPVATLGPVSLKLGGIEVAPPPGGFLQASAAGERAIVDAVLAGLPRRGTGRLRVADLYAGTGTLTFPLAGGPLAGGAVVAAYEGDAASAAALRDAANRGGLAGRVTVETRDLARRPLQPQELARFDAVVLDPPYAGAAPQIGPIVTAGVPRVIYVSCNPAALARDAAALRVAGYAVLAATPIDQFLWSSRLESVVVFDRARRRVRPV